LAWKEGWRVRNWSFPFWLMKWLSIPLGMPHFYGKCIVRKNLHLPESCAADSLSSQVQNSPDCLYIELVGHAFWWATTFG
jgi:hypothetical protein